MHVEWFPRAPGKEGDVVVGGDAPRGIDLLAQLGVLPDQVLVVRDGVPIPADTILGAGDRLRLVLTVSGG